MSTANIVVPSEQMPVGDCVAGCVQGGEVLARVAGAVGTVVGEEFGGRPALRDPERIVVAPDALWGSLLSLCRSKPLTRGGVGDWDARGPE